ncbi:MAG: hypothetical protein K2L84_01825 [Muribaculaceae bacterium]|nr:hypothetical protein [Muribaculaceae bacterium]
MKKFYSFILALAAVAFGATAFTPANVAPHKAKVQFGAVEAQPLERADLGAAPSFSAPSFKMPVPKTAEDIQGVYELWGMGHSVTEDETALLNARYFGDITCIVKEGNNVEVGPFFYDGVYFDGVFDAEAQTLTIPAGQSATATISGKSVDLTMYDYDWDTGTAKDIVFHVNAEKNMLSYESTGSLQPDNQIIVGEASAAVGNYWITCISLYAYKCNSYMTSKEVDKYNQLQDFTDLVYAEKDGNILKVYNFCGNGFNDPISFTVDKTAKTATALNQVYANINGSDYYIWRVAPTNGALIDRNAIFTIEMNLNSAGEQEGYVVTLPYIAIATADQNSGWYVYSINILVPFDIYAESGVGVVEVQDENAPVEYYNLQGVRVQNPENGMYIRRQGTKTSKVIVK